MPLPETNQTNDSFFWLTRATPSAGYPTDFYLVPIPCRVKGVQGIMPGASGGGTDLVIQLRISGGATLATITFPQAGSAEGGAATITNLNTTTTLDRGDRLDIEYVSGAWTTTTLFVSTLVELQAA